MKFEIFNHFTSLVQLTSEIECNESDSYPVKLGLAVKWAVKMRANLAGAHIPGANLKDSDLAGVNFASTNFTYANLAGVNLAGSNLAGANLMYVNFENANLEGVNLAGAYLVGAYLKGANLADANLAGANLTSVYFEGVKNTELVIAKACILPEGDLIGWKKCQNEVIVKLKIPENAKRTNAFRRNCRAEFVDVLEVIGAEVGLSVYDNGETKYEAGKRVMSDSFEENLQEDLASGIHFFITRAEAEAF